MKKLSILTILLISQFSGAVFAFECIEGNCQDGVGTAMDSGIKYTGEWKDSKRNGTGETIWKDGKKYVGEYRDNFFDGYGIMSYPSGTIYIGDWVKGLQTGKGKKIWGKDTKWAGDIYEGDFLRGERVGRGTYTWAKTGNTYVGQFVDNQRNGKGRLTFASGRVLEGDWINNELVREKTHSTVNQPYKKIYTESPKYPKDLLKKGIEGNCIVEYTIRTSGAVGNIKVYSCSNYDFANASIEAAGKFRYTPAKVNGVAQETTGVKHSIRFVLDKNKNNQSVQKNNSKPSNNQAYDECMKLVAEEERDLSQTRSLLAILSLNKNNNVSKGIRDADKQEKEIRRMKQQCICYLNNSGNCSTIYLDKDIDIGIK